MVDAADVMRDLLRKGLQVNIVIVLTFQISIVIDMIIINMVINIKNNMIIMIKHQADLFVPRAELLLTEEEISLSDTNSPGKVQVA